MAIESILTCHANDSHPSPSPHQGLNAGFELGEKLKSSVELKKEWEEFKRRREAENLTASTTVKV